MNKPHQVNCCYNCKHHYYSRLYEEDCCELQSFQGVDMICSEYEREVKMVMINLTEQDLQDITVALVTMHMKHSPPRNDLNYTKRCGDLHDKIQITRRLLENANPK